MGYSEQIHGSAKTDPLQLMLRIVGVEACGISFKTRQQLSGLGVRGTPRCSGGEGTLDCSPPGSSVHGIFKAGVLEWGAISFSVILIMRGPF